MYRAQIFLQPQPVKANGKYSVSITRTTFLNFIYIFRLIQQTRIFYAVHVYSKYFERFLFPSSGNSTVYIKQKVYHVGAFALQAVVNIIDTTVIISNNGIIIKQYKN